VFDVAEKLGYEYFLVLDDDYTDFRYKFDGEYNYINIKKIKNLDKAFSYMFNYLDKVKKIKCLAWAQGGDFIGGKEAKRIVETKRKIMNSFFLSTKRRFKFVGRINEDVNTYVELGLRGDLVFQTNQIALQQMLTQTNNGGLTDFYLDNGTYVKSFYTILCNPSSVKIGLMGNNNKRLHHKIKWNNTASVVIKEKYKKLL